MNKCARKLAGVIAISVAVSTLSLAFHYYARLRLLEHKAVLVQPGKWVWVECQTDNFAASIEEVNASGIVVFVGATSSKGLLCKAAGITARGEHRYFSCHSGLCLG